jgi:hypothetical protein
MERLSERLARTRRLITAITAIAVVSGTAVVMSALPAAAAWKSAQVTVGVGSGVPVSLTPMQPSNCSRDETASSFTTSGAADKQTLWFVSKADGSCAFERSYNTWQVTLPGGGAGSIWHGQRDLYGFYTIECDGNWSKYRCMYPEFPGFNPYTVQGVIIAPPECTQTLAVGSSCSARQPGINDDLSFTSGLSLDNHNYLTMRNIGNVGCIEKGVSRPMFVAAGQEIDNWYNVGGTQKWVSAYDKQGGKTGLPCIMSFTAHRNS